MRRMINKLHSQGRSCFCFFYISGTPHARHIRTLWNFEVGPFIRHFLLLSFFLSFDVAMKGIQSTQLHCHISFLSFVRLTTCFFLSCWGWLLDSRKLRLFCLHIQHAIRYLFEWRIPVGSSEAAVCRFCLSISLHLLHSAAQYCILLML